MRPDYYYYKYMYMCNQTICPNKWNLVQTEPKCLENVISSTIHMYSCMLYLITSTLYSKKLIIQYMSIKCHHTVTVITLAAKRRRKGTVIILCVCVCVFTKFSKNYEHWWLELDTGRLQIIQGSKVTTGFW